MLMTTTTRSSYVRFLSQKKDKCFFNMLIEDFQLKSYISTEIEMSYCRPRSIEINELHRIRITSFENRNLMSHITFLSIEISQPTHTLSSMWHQMFQKNSLSTSTYCLLRLSSFNRKSFSFFFFFCIHTNINDINSINKSSIVYKQ